MSRSKRPQCSVGRGCGCCGNAGASRRKREKAWAKADRDAHVTDRDHKNTGHPYHFDGYYVGKRHQGVL